MATSIKIKFRNSTIKDKEGVLCLQLIHNRRIKLLRTRFRLFSTEWDKKKETVFWGNARIERQIHLQSIQTGIETEFRQLEELIGLLEMKSDYTVDELADLYTSNSFNGFLFPFVDYIVKNLKESNSQTIDDYLLPVYTVQNRDNTSQLRNHNKRLKRISDLLGLEKSLSSYVTRHTWATLALRKGVPVEVISESMGHENETTTRIYLASLGQSVVDEANAKIINLE